MSEISVIFQEKVGQKNTIIKAKSNIKFSELIEKYYKIEYISKRDRNKYIFIFMEKEIISTCEKNLIELGIKDYSKITIELAKKIVNSYSELEELKKENEKLQKLKNEMLQRQKEIRKGYNKKKNNAIEKEKEEGKKEEEKEKEEEKKKNDKINITLEDMCIYGNIIKQEIKEIKKNNPEKFIKTEEALKKKDNDEGLFALALLATNLEQYGIETVIEKETDKVNINDKDRDEEDLTCLQFLSNGLINKRKYDLHFDLGEKRNNELINNKEEYEKFKKNLILKLSKDYNVPEDQIIVTFPQKGSLRVQVIFQSDEFNNLDLEQFKNKFKNDEDFKELNTLKEIHNDTIVGACTLTKEMLDPRGNRNSGWGINEKRGNKPYDPPIGWNGIGLKVMDKYENNKWIGMSNSEGEWCVAYHGVAHGQTSDNVKKVTGLIYKGGFKPGSGQAHEGCPDQFHPGKLVGRGVYCTPTIKTAENWYAGISEINGVRYKTVLMVRVKPDAIRHCDICNDSKAPNNYWVVNGTTDEIRPYRILYKSI